MKVASSVRDSATARCASYCSETSLVVVSTERRPPISTNRADTEPQNCVPSRRRKRARKSSRASSAPTRSQKDWRTAGSTQNWKSTVVVLPITWSRRHPVSRSMAGLISMICCVAASIIATASGLSANISERCARLWARAVAVSDNRARSRWYTRTSTQHIITMPRPLPANPLARSPRRSPGRANGVASSGHR